MKPLWFVGAWISFAVGIVGVFLPILPTTPFLILSAYLFSKSSPRFHAWVVGLPMVGAGIRDWQETRSIRPRAKVMCALMIALSLIIVWRSQAIHRFVKVGVSVTLVSVAGYVLTRKSK